MTLLAEIQGVIERTYSPAGVNLEDCLIPRRRSRELAARAADGAVLAEEACTFLRLDGGNLRIAIFFAPELIETLEREDPRESLSHRNVRALISFMEEITHGVHAALAFRRGRRRWDSEAFACALEAQARVDVYYLLLRFVRLIAGEVGAGARDWVRAAVFAAERAPGGPPRLRRRYARAGRIARAFTARVDALPSGERRAAIRAFHAAPLAGKARMAGVPRQA
jgi:hypothetical protein